MRPWVVACLAAALAACEKSPPPFTRAGDAWRYRDFVIGADAATFRYIDRGYARDATHVYDEGERRPVCGRESDGGARRAYVKALALDADVATFAVSDVVGGDADAKDARGALKRGERVR